MESLIIEGTEDSPSVAFDIKSNCFTISGKSRPENSGKFFTPIIKWITEFEQNLLNRKNLIADNPNIVFIVKLDYFNSISAKYILDIILMLKEVVLKGQNVEIKWHYSKPDVDMLETGKEFSTMVNLEFDFIAH
jgi:hypothetical protein